MLTMALKIFSKDTVTVQYAWETPFLCVGDSVAIMSWKGGQRHAEKYKVQSKQIIKPPWQEELLHTQCGRSRLEACPDRK